jgi:hypothetical protein
MCNRREDWKHKQQQETALAASVTANVMNVDWNIEGRRIIKQLVWAVCDYYYC